MLWSIHYTHAHAHTRTYTLTHKPVDRKRKVILQILLCDHKSENENIMLILNTNQMIDYGIGGLTQHNRDQELHLTEGRLWVPFFLNV